MKYNIIIIGAGVTGSFIARELSKYNASVLLLEKFNDVGNGVSNANSAIVHSGYDPEPNTKKAKFNVEGNKMFSLICKELDVDFKRIGSLTLCKESDDKRNLYKLLERAKSNNVEAYVINKEELHKMEDKLASDVECALFCPSAGIIDQFNLVTHAVENAIDNGIELQLSCEVKNIIDKDDYLEVITSNGIFSCDYLINASGLGSIDIAKMLDKNLDISITPRKGEYYILDKLVKQVSHVCFPLPNELGKGILVSPTVHGNTIVGPNNVLGSNLEDFSTDQKSLKDISLKASSYHQNIPFNRTIKIFSGVRPTINSTDFIVDFSKTSKRMINLLGIDSPGLASSPSIAKYVCNDLLKVKELYTLNENFNPFVKKYIRMKELSTEEKNELIKKNKDYGIIICNCEKITLGEIKDYLSRSVPINSIKGLRKRTRAGFGKCQGGFCQPLIVPILNKNNNIVDVLYDQEGSNLLMRKAK